MKMNDIHSVQFKRFRIKEEEEEITNSAKFTMNVPNPIAGIFASLLKLKVGTAMSQD